MKLVVATLALAAGCAQPPGITAGADSTRTFTPAKIDLARYPTTCGVAAPPFLPGDLYGLDLTGAAAGSAAPTALDLSFQPTVPLHQDLPVTLQPFGVLSYTLDPSGNRTNVHYGQSGTLALGGDSSFTWLQGSDPAEVDAAPLASAALRFDRIPAQEGDDAIVRFKLTFNDGGVLDLTVVEPVVTSISGCPAG